MSFFLDGAMARLAIAGFISGATFFGALATTGVKAHYACESATINGTSGNDDLVGDGGSDASHDHADYISAHAGHDRLAGHDCGD